MSDNNPDPELKEVLTEDFPVTRAEALEYKKSLGVTRTKEEAERIAGEQA